MRVEPRDIARSRELEDLRRHAVEVGAENVRLTARVAALEASSSWRLTTPLRAVILACHRARQWPARVRSWLASEGRTPRGPSTPPEAVEPLPLPRLPRRILIVAEVSIPQCLRYRVRQKADALVAMGYPTTVVSWRDAARCRKELAAHGCVIFYRTPAVPDVVRLARTAKAAGMMTFFEIDDLVFDANEYSRNSNLRALPPEERDNLLRGARLYREMIRHVDGAVASTQLIADRLASLGAAGVFVVNNGLDAIHLAATEGSAPKAGGGAVTIVYGSGTDTHDADFAVAAEPLARVMRENPHVRLVLAGPLRLPGELDGLTARVIRLPIMPVEDYQACLARCDISLAPLEPGPFNDAKSNIKFLEASVVGLPSVCSPAAEFVRVIKEGANGFLASSPEEWHAKLSLLVSDAGLRRRIGQAAKADVLREFHPDNLTRRQLEPVLGLAFGDGAADRTAALKVLVVNVHFAPESFGGATVVAEQLAAELGRMRDTEVSVFTGTHLADVPCDALHRRAWNGVPVYSVRLSAVGDSPADHENPRAARLFAEALDVVRPDVIHFHCLQMLSADLVKVAQSRGIPHVITLHDAWWICERQFMVTAQGRYCGQPGVDPFKCVGCTADGGFTQRRFRQLRQVMEGAPRILTPSAFFRDLHVRTGLAPERITVSRNGVLPAKPRRRTSSGDPRITLAFLGGRGLHKGYFWLQEVMAGIAGTNYRLKIPDLGMIHGHRSIQRGEWKIAGELDITAPYAQETIDEYFADIDVLLFPSLWKESFGLTVREALLRDIWVISTDCGGPVEDLVDGVNGTIVPMGDTAAMQAAIRRALLDPGRIKNHVNPRKDAIRTFADQAREAREILASIATRHHAT